ncbi:hypothetical protein ABT352_33300 [Streptosporangium sp. NPDC000563]|uniref:hypothetical protein n=1 Tax=Streptosporangium sp. NPDC000563 TaxID=3154366 RepID=UPI00332CFEF3
MRDTVLSYIRTYVPVWVAALVGLAAEAQIDLPLESTTIVATAALISVYYLIGRTLEKVPGLEWLGKVLLSAGVAGAPSYDQSGEGRGSQSGGGSYGYGAGGGSSGG